MPQKLDSDNTFHADFCLRRIGDPASKREVKDIMPLNKDSVSFGRRQGSVDYYLDSNVYANMISRAHSEIQRFYDPTDDTFRYKIVDKSLNGTYVNDTRVDGDHVLDVDDVITFGHLNGVNVKPGVYSRQKKSEFKFVFEPMSGKNGSASPSGYGMKRPYDDGYLSNKKRRTSGADTKHDRTSAFDNYEIPSRFKGMKKEDDRRRRDSSSSSVSSSSGTSSSSERVKKSGKTSQKQSSGKRGPKIKHTPLRKGVVNATSSKGRSSSGGKKSGAVTQDGQPQLWEDDKCEHEDCQRPQDSLCQWVCCDDCDKWYHTICLGVDYKKVQKLKHFNCGCVAG